MPALFPGARSAPRARVPVRVVARPARARAPRAGGLRAARTSLRALEDLATMSMVSPKYDAKFKSRGVRKGLRHWVGDRYRLPYWRKVLDVYHVRAEILMKNHGSGRGLLPRACTATRRRRSSRDSAAGEGEAARGAGPEGEIRRDVGRTCPSVARSSATRTRPNQNLLATVLKAARSRATARSATARA